jgi:Zinc finger, C2H2 type
MICDRCLKELNAAFEFAERSRIAEKLHFAKLREEFEQQEPEETEEVEVTEAEHEAEKMKKEPSIDIETVEIEMFDDTEMIDESEVNEEMNADADEEEELPQMFAVQAIAKSSSKLKVPVSANKKKKISKAKQQPLQCPICSKGFSRTGNHRHHIAAVHEKKTRFTCPYCPKAFYRKDGLQIHITQCHTFTNDDTTNSNRPFRCDIDNCGKFFKIKGELKKHQVVHSSEFRVDNNLS